MAISSEFKNAVSQNKLIRVRIILKDNMVIDPTLKGFDEMVRYAENNIPNLYDEHDGEKLDYDMAAWTKNYMDEQMVIAVNNFSKERIELLKKIVKKVYGVRVKNIKEKRINENSASVYITKKQVGKGLAMGGTAVAVVGIVVAETLVVAAGTVAAVAGIAMIISDN